MLAGAFALGASAAQAATGHISADDGCGDNATVDVNGRTCCTDELPTSGGTPGESAFDDCGPTTRRRGST
jgi:hypothetical protein